MPDKPTPHNEHRDQMGEIMMELASIRTELKEVRTLTRKVYRFVWWQKFWGTVKIVFVVLIVLGAISLFQKYVPGLYKQFNQAYSEFQSISPKYYSR